MPGDLPQGLFVNPIAEGADPCVVRDGDRYLWCQAEGNVGVSIWVSDRLTTLGSKHVIWLAEAEGPCSKEVWAPELIRFDERWYVYFAASDGRNRNHRTFVLAADTDDPLGSWTLHGPLFTGEAGGENLWSIDFTVLDHGGRRYGIWSGWPDAGTDLQHLYAAEMDSPTEITRGRVMIAEAGLHPWERVDETAQSRGLLEGPRCLVRGGRVFLLYSCAASWLPTYKLGVLELIGDDPLAPDAWRRSDQPVFGSTRATYGVGHGDTIEVDGEWWHLFHSKIDRRDGWRRTIHLQPMAFDGDGNPQLGAPLARGDELETPAGTPASERRDEVAWTFDADTDLRDFAYYGHHQYIEIGPDGLDLGIEPAERVNDFRCGEKLVLVDGDYEDVEARATFRFIGGERAAGVMVRLTGPAVGYDAQRGYFAGLSQDRSSLILGKTDGVGWTILAETPTTIDLETEHTVIVRARGSRIDVSAGTVRLGIRDDDYTRGTVAVRVADAHARFTALSVKPLAEDE